MASNTPSGSAASSSVDSENFTYRLIEAVKNQPCLYNPNHEHYGSKQANVQYRCHVWEKICADLGFKEGAHNLQSLWKKVRDRYVRERKKRRNSILSDGSAQQQENASGRERHPSGSSSCSTSSGQIGSPAVRQFELMRWIDPFLGDAAANNSGVANHNVVSESSVALAPPVQSTSSISTTQSLQLTQQQDTQGVNATVDGSLNNSFSPSAQQSQQSVPVQQVAPLQSQHDYAAPPRSSVSNSNVGPSKPTPGPSSAAGSPCSSTTSSEIDVGSVATFGGQSQQRAQSQQQSTQHHLAQHQPSTIIVTTVPQHQRQSQGPPQQFIFPKSESQSAVGQSVQTADGSIVTVTARGTAPMVGYVKKDVSVKNDGCSTNSNTWLVDPTSIYQHGTQKMYRLVNLADVNDGTTLISSGLGPSTSEVKIGSPTRKKMRVTLSTQGLPNGRGQIGDELIIDDGIAPKTVTIEQTISPPIMDDGLLHDHHNTLAVGGTSVMLSHHNVQQVHQQHPTTSQQQSSATHHAPVTQLMVPHGAQINVVSTRHQTTTGQRFIQQPVTVQPQMQYTVLTSQPLPPQHDEEIEFTNSIAAHLSRLNEDEKAVAKMNIQRILMDARFGIGACARMIHEEEFNEATVATAVSHDLTSAQQQHVENASRR